VASGILKAWDRASTRFVKVFPADYKRVLAELEAEQATVESTGEAVAITGKGN